MSNVTAPDIFAKAAEQRENFEEVMRMGESMEPKRLARVVEAIEHLLAAEEAVPGILAAMTKARAADREALAK